MGEIHKCLGVTRAHSAEGSNYTKVPGYFANCPRSAWFNCFVVPHRFLIAKIVPPFFGVKNDLLQREEKRSRVVDRRRKDSPIYGLKSTLRHRLRSQGFGGLCISGDSLLSGVLLPSGSERH